MMTYTYWPLHLSLARCPAPAAASCKRAMVARTAARAPCFCSLMFRRSIIDAGLIIMSRVCRALPPASELSVTDTLLLVLCFGL